MTATVIPSQSKPHGAHAPPVAGDIRISPAQEALARNGGTTLYGSESSHVPAG
jgi:hypothetical protein